MSSMECFSCKEHQRKFYCLDCLHTHLREFRTKTQLAASERDGEVTKATRSLAAIEGSRLARAEAATLEDSIKGVNKETNNIRHSIETTRTRVATLRQSLTERRAALASAKHITSSSAQAVNKQTPTGSLRDRIQSTTEALEYAQDRLAVTRRVLIKTLVETFDLREAPPAVLARSNKSSLPPPSYPKFSSASASYLAGAGMALFGRTAFGAVATGSPQAVHGKAEWSIAGLALPVPGDLSRSTPEHITAALTHTLHFLRLLTFYLGVKLPFEVTWTGGSPGVGRPFIAAGRGSDHGGWAGWTNPHPLFYTSAATSSSSSGSSRSPSTSTSSSPSEPTNSSIESLTVAVCMLNYNVAYLSYTQGLEVPLSLTGETIRNLWNICLLPGLGRTSHGTLSHLHPLPFPTSPFPLDFGQLLQITSPSGSKLPLRGAASKARRALAKTKPDEGDWDLVEVPEGEEGVG